MATKLSKSQIAELAKLEITKVMTVEEATKILIKKLKVFDVTDVEKDPIDDLISMYEAFFDVDAGVEEVEEAEEPVEEEETEEEAEEGLDLSTLDRNALKAYIKENALEVKVTTKMTDEDIRDAIIAAVNPEEEEAEEEVIEEGPTKKAKAATAKITGSGWDKENETHMKMLEPFKKLFKGITGIVFNLISSGITVFVELKNAKKSIVRFCDLRVDGKNLVGSLDFTVFSHDLKSAEAFLEPFEVEIKNYDNRLPLVKPITMVTIAEILTPENIAELVAKLEGADKKLGANKAKLDEKMTSKKGKAEVAEEVEEEVVEGEDPLGLNDMDRNELKKLIKDSELDVKVTTKMTDEDIRQAINDASVEEVELEVEEEVEEVEEPEVKKPAAKKVAPAVPAKKVVAKKK